MQMFTFNLFVLYSRYQHIEL